MFCSWGAEEPQIMGASEWTEVCLDHIDDKMPYYRQNKIESKKIAPEIVIFKLDLIKFKLLWPTGQVKTLFSLKNKVQHTAKVVYLGKCPSFKVGYVGEPCRNFKTRLLEHENPNHNSEPANRIALNKERSFE